MIGPISDTKKDRNMVLYVGLVPYFGLVWLLLTIFTAISFSPGIFISQIVSPPQRSFESTEYHLGNADYIVAFVISSAIVHFIYHLAKCIRFRMEYAELKLEYNRARLSKKWVIWRRFILGSLVSISGTSVTVLYFLSSSSSIALWNYLFFVSGMCLYIGVGAIIGQARFIPVFLRKPYLCH
jgi:hypothetical protein